MRPFVSSRVIQIRYSSALSILIYFDFLELFSLILTLPASLAYLLTCGSAAVERGSRGSEKRWRVCGVSGCGQGKRRSFQRAGTGELGTLLFFPGAREAQAAAPDRRARCGAKGRGAWRSREHTLPSLPPLVVVFFAQGFTHVFLALAHELPQVLNSVDLLAQHGTQLPVQLRQRGLRVQHSPKPVRVLGVRPDRRVRAALRDEGRGNVTTTVRKKKRRGSPAGRRGAGDRFQNGSRESSTIDCRGKGFGGHRHSASCSAYLFVVDSQDRLPDLLRTAVVRGRGGRRRADRAARGSRHGAKPRRGAAQNETQHATRALSPPSPFSVAAALCRPRAPRFCWMLLARKIYDRGDGAGDG